MTDTATARPTALGGLAPGLTQNEAERRLARVGPNELPHQPSRGVVVIVRDTLREPMFLLLLGASGLYLSLGDLAEGLFMTAGAAASIGLVVFQEFRSERALQALRSLAEPHAHVIRGGLAALIPARELVPGDLMLVVEGARLPADAVLIAGDVLSVDESTLTGESAAVMKQPSPVDAATFESDAPGGDSGGRLFAGTLVVRGQGQAEVILTGARTALGKVGASLVKIEQEPTPLQRTAGRVVTVLGAFALAFCALVAIAYGLLRGDWIKGALSGVTVAIGLIPEEYPMVLAVFLAIGAWRLAKHKVLVRRPAVIEALGAASMLCVDKTGTLTENRMRVVRLVVDGRAVAVDDGAVPSEMAALVRAANLASAARAVDPMDRAIQALEAAATDSEAVAAEPHQTWPLRPERLAVVQLWRNADGAEVAGAKGAPEAIFRLCRLDPAQVAELQRTVGVMAAEGLRVLAAASWRQATSFPGDPADTRFDFEGLIGFLDPVRPDVPAALEEARRAGVEVAMITGDHPATALEIAGRAGLDIAGGVLTGPEMTRLDPAALQARILATRVFARIQPEQKLLIVEAFKAAGRVVAMTGDGVNDAPALEAAHIGIAMGLRGADVAREAADLVLLDDSFASIIGGVRLGRGIFANLRKALTYITAIHVPIAGLALLPIIMGLPALLMPMHVVLLELVIDPVCSLVFEAAPTEPNAMRRPPRSPKEPLFGAAQIWLALAQGGVLLAAVLGLYLWADPRGAETAARGAAFVALVVGNLSLAMTDSAASGARLFDRRRAAYWVITAAALAVLAAMLLIPDVSRLFQVSRPAPELAVVSVGVGIAAGAWLGVARGLIGAAALLRRPTAAG